MSKKHGIIGLKGLALAPIKQDSILGYETSAAESLPFVGVINFTPDQSDQKFYYDDSMYARVMDTNGYDVEIRLAEMALEDFEKYGMGTYDETTNTLQSTFEAAGERYALRFVADTVDKAPNYFNFRVFQINSIRWGNFTTKGSNTAVNEVVITGVAMKPQYAGLAPLAVMGLKDDGSNQAACNTFLTASEKAPKV